MGDIILIAMFFGAIYKISGIAGIVDFINMVGMIVWKLLKSINISIMHLNNEIGLLPTVLAGSATVLIVKWLIDGKRYGKVSDTIIEKTLGKAAEDIITPVLNWINRIIFK